MKIPPRLRVAVQVLAGVAAVTLGVLAISDRWSEVSSRISQLGPGSVIGASSAIALAEVATMMSWRALLTDFGNRLPARAAARIVYLAALGKYLPGSVWPYVAQVQIGRRYGVPRPRSAAVSVLVVLISLITGLLLAAACMPWLSAATTRRYWPVFLAVPVIGALLHPRVISRLVRVARPTALEGAVSWRGVGSSGAWATFFWLMSGVQIWILGSGLTHLGIKDLPLCIGAYGLAWCAGFLVVIAPAGAGVREAVLTAALSPVMSTSAALAVALLARAITTAGDLGAAAVAGLLHPPAPPASDGSVDTIDPCRAPG